MDGSDSDRIVAVSTAPGLGAIGIVRLSGPGSRKALEALIEGPCGPPWRLSLRTLIDPEDGAPLDRGMVWWAPAPRSYTGEELAEIQAHGNPVILEALVQACCYLGARPANAGEFTRRALRNGKLDLTAAEAIQAAAEAHTLDGAKLAMRALTGELGQRVGRLRTQLLAAAATVEAAVDYPEDVDLEDPGTLARDLTKTASELRRMGRRVREAGRLLWGADVAILGPVNAGKSTLFNRLLGQERAIVDVDPGTTRDVVTGEREFGGVRVRLHDTAGFRDGVGGVEDEGMRRARALRERVDLVLYVEDARSPGAVPPEPGDRWILNKLDLLEPGGIIPGEAHALSAKTGKGVASLEAMLAAEIGDHGGPATVLWTARQGAAATAAADGVARAAAALHEAEFGPAAAELGEALRGLEELLGVDPTEAVLDELFARFCVGK